MDSQKTSGQWRLSDSGRKKEPLPARIVTHTILWTLSRNTVCVTVFPVILVSWQNLHSHHLNWIQSTLCQSSLIASPFSGISSVTYWMASFSQPPPPPHIATGKPVTISPASFCSIYLDAKLTHTQLLDWHSPPWLDVAGFTPAGFTLAYPFGIFSFNSSNRFVTFESSQT